MWTPLKHAFSTCVVCVRVRVQYWVDVTVMSVIVIYMYNVLHLFVIIIISGSNLPSTSWAGRSQSCICKCFRPPFIVTILYSCIQVVVLKSLCFENSLVARTFTYECMYACVLCTESPPPPPPPHTRACTLTDQQGTACSAGVQRRWPRGKPPPNNWSTWRRILHWRFGSIFARVSPLASGLLPIV